MTTQAATKFLTYAGALPFIATTAVLIIGDSVRFPVDIQLVMQVYAALLISFLAGIHWHIGLSQAGAPSYLLFVSNMFVLLAWVIIFLADISVSWLLLTILFVGLILLDRALFRMGLLPEWFFHLRIRISMIVIAASTSMALMTNL